MSERGVFQHENRGRQLLRFDDFRYGNITPTDIDAVIDYKNYVWVFFEAKLKDKDVLFGQKLALERLIQNAFGSKKHGIAMIVEHDEEDATKDIILKNCMVREIYTTENMKWRPPNYDITAKDMSDAYINYHVNCVNYKDRHNRTSRRW